MGNRPSANAAHQSADEDETPATSPKSPRVSPAEFAQRELVKRALRDTRSELDETQKELTATRTKLVHVEKKIDKLMNAILEKL